MSYPTFAAVIALCVLSACNSVAPTDTPPVSPAIKNPDINNKRITGYQEITIRSFVPGEGVEQFDRALGPSPDERVEIENAKCVIETAEFILTFTTPRTLALPKFTSRPTRGTLKCVRGDLQGGVSISPVPNTPVFGLATPTGLLVAALTANIAANRDVWVYSIPQITLYPAEADVTGPFEPATDS
ncbi:hypothetical protein KMP13_19550 [Epibacterium ulvae]|uniref:hypothetical protein n=1 Tax=Epibacterium ulvae TaxID=1156985 RepID=UPI001BFCD012|nr:hypothetical protein [Epibacterium ulvae]MBT8156013.1 hypothetical protein [Epibacterium ulvae]